jgi:hypothetical protein
MNCALTADTTDFIPEDFLASTADLVGILAQLAGSTSLMSSRRRSDGRLVEAALSKLLRGMDTTVPLPPAPARMEAHAAVVAPARRAPAEAWAGLSRPQRRQYCNCGQCKWCLDNARWDRIFNEKFADPAYYGGIVVKHNSTLAEAL